MAFLPLTSLSNLIADLGQIENFLAATVTTVGSIVALSPSPTSLKIVAIAGSVVTDLGVVIANARKDAALAASTSAPASAPAKK